MGISKMRGLTFIQHTAIKDHCNGNIKSVKRGKCKGRNINLSVSASDGLLFGAASPAHYDLTIEETEGQTPKVFGKASAFPALEIYMYDSSGSHLVYSYDSKAAGKNVLNITDNIYLNDKK
jgi:hypothetical protein